MAWVHRVLSVDEESRTLVCANCGPVHAAWKSGRWKCGVTRDAQRGAWIDEDGYRKVATPTGRAFEHRLVMEGILGRPLLPHENVHHRNGVRADNRPENLELWITKQPRGQTPEDLVEWAREIMDLYG